MRPIFPSVFLLPLLGIALWGCGVHDRAYTESAADYGETAAYETENGQAAPETKTTESVASWTALATFGTSSSPADTSRKFIRTAQLKFRVKDLPSTAQAIEALVRRQNGFIENSDLHNSVLSIENTPVSADSVVETTTYRLSCTMTLRLPADRLDSALLEIAQYIDFPDYRKVQSQDVALDILTQQLVGDRYKKYASDLKRQARKDSSADPLFDRAEQADRARIKLMRLADRIDFSTIKLEIYQRESIRREVLPTDTDISTYEPGFRDKASHSLTIGWQILQNIILLLLRIWWLLAIGAIILLIIRYNKHRRNNRSKTTDRNRTTQQ